MLCFDVLFSMRNRPARDQRAYYNGHKRKHAIKVQGVVTPDGIVVDLFGPELGARHDVHLFNESGVLLTLAQHMTSPSGDPYPVSYTHLTLPTIYSV